MITEADPCLQRVKSYNPHGRRTQNQVLAKPAKRTNTKPTEEPQSKRRKVNHTSVHGGDSLMIMAGSAPRDGQQNNSADTRATSEDELDMITSNTSPDRYPRASTNVQGALAEDPIVVDGEIPENDLPVKGRVKKLTEQIESKSNAGPEWRDLRDKMPAKLRMKTKAGVSSNATTFQMIPLKEEPTIYFKKMQSLPASPTSKHGAGRLMWKNGFEVATNSGHTIRRNLTNTCKGLKFCRDDSKKFSFLEITLSSKKSDEGDVYAFWFEGSEPNERTQFKNVLAWLSTFKEAENISADDIERRWGKDTEPEPQTDVIGLSSSDKVARLQSLRNSNGEPLHPRPNLSRKLQRYTPDTELPATKKAQTPAPTSVSTGPPVRRSTRNSAISAPPQDSPDKPTEVLEPDKVILSYPQGVPGAVNVTNADLARLRPGEFLNDTLIEVGLKLWLKDVEEQDPELASQIHIFNSFFYKKFNQQKKGQQGYDNVKKWTSKLDIFQKKYIIVPINENMHWYLAIIYEPEHVLREAPVNTPATRRQAKTAPTADKEKPEEKEETVAHAPQLDATESMDTSSEGEVERDLNLHDFQASCTIEDEEIKQKDADAISEGGHSDLSYVSDPRSRTQHIPMEVQESDEQSRVAEPLDESTQPASPAPMDDPLNMTPGAVSSESFYSRRKVKKVTAIETDVKDEEEVEFVETFPRTHIFVFDSLGIRHTAVGKNLSNYLKMEALDKKGVINASNCESKIAAVPIQPNFCDCGLYLLHFAKVFMNDPAGYFKHIVTPKPKMSNSEYLKLKKDRWRDEEVPGLRGHLKQRIVELSNIWLKDRPAGKTPPLLAQDATKVDDSDSDVDIVETTIQLKGKQKGPRAGQR
ncbi:hypothetical protein BJ165DRAFT_1163354 [Panaeolus papilionaceus]|nr:hypothetical protein BJ165DRAFT_1163354 [Panaeolus papilionaceus]